VQISASGLNVRTGPSTGNSIIGAVYQGQKYAYEGKSGSWFRIRFDNRTGYVYEGTYSFATSTPLSTVAVSGLNVRTGPGTNYGIAGQIFQGQRFALTGSTSGSWVQIYHGGSSRWVYGPFMRSESTPAPPPPPPPPPAPTPAINVSFFTLGAGNPASTSTRTITTRHFFQGNGNQVRDYRMSENASFAGAFWQTYTGRPNFTLSSGNGLKRVYFQLRDTNFRTSNVRSDTISLNVPTETPRINISFFALGAGNPASTSSRFITTRHFYQSNGNRIRDYRMSENSNFAGAFWQTHTARPNFVLSDGNGTKRVYFQVRDTNFRTSNVRSDTITLLVSSGHPDAAAEAALGQRAITIPADNGSQPPCRGVLTSEIGIVEGSRAGSPAMIRLCAIDNGTATPLRVNSTISLHVSAMVGAAKADGITLTASEDFRTMERQQYFWDCYQEGLRLERNGQSRRLACNNGNTAARPGYSNHQTGLALDFRLTSGVQSWLERRAATFGLYARVPREPWHYSPTGF